MRLKRKTEKLNREQVVDTLKKTLEYCVLNDKIAIFSICSPIIHSQNKYLFKDYNVNENHLYIESWSAEISISLKGDDIEITYKNDTLTVKRDETEIMLTFIM